MIHETKTEICKKIQIADSFLNIFRPKTSSHVLLRSAQSALSDLLPTSATHGTFSRPSTKRGLILIGVELNTSARESFEHWAFPFFIRTGGWT